MWELRCLGALVTSRRFAKPLARCRRLKERSYEGFTVTGAQVHHLVLSHRSRRIFVSIIGARRAHDLPSLAQLDDLGHARGSKVTPAETLSPGASDWMPVSGTPREKRLMASAILLTGSTQK